MLSGRSSGRLASPITSRMAMRSPSVSVVSKPAPSGGASRCKDSRPSIGLLERARPVLVERRGQVLAKTPAVRRAVMIDDAHLVVAEAIDAIFIKKELRVLNQEVAHFGLAEVEHKAAGMALSVK